MKPQLDSTVPEEIAFLFEVARGSMIYALFFLPLASLAAEQCYRVLEAGARHRCQQLALLKKKPGNAKVLPDTSFADVVAALQEADQIPLNHRDTWKTIPFSRNFCSHPKSQMIHSRRDAVRVLQYHAELLNHLFHDGA